MGLDFETKLDEAIINSSVLSEDIARFMMACCSDQLMYQQAKEIALKVVHNIEELESEFTLLLGFNDKSQSLMEILLGIKSFVLP